MLHKHPLDKSQNMLIFRILRNVSNPKSISLKLRERVRESCRSFAAELAVEKNNKNARHKMAEEQRPPGFFISKAIRSERKSSSEVDHKNLKDTLAKSSLWKTNTLQRIENARSGHAEDGQSGHMNDRKDAVLQLLKRELLQVVERHWQDFVPNPDATSDQPLEEKPRASAVDDDQSTPRDARMHQEYKGMRAALTVHVKEAIKARRRLREQAATLKKRSEEIERLQQTILQLRAENTSLATQHQNELDGTRNQFFDLQAAYDQFQQQSDQLLTELDQENERLRAGRTH